MRARLPVPLSILDMHTILLSKTRTGKSSTMRLLAEALLKKKKPVCILSSKDDWWGIRSSANGKSSGFPVVLFGGTKADHPINAHSGAILGALLATGNRPASITTAGMTIADRTIFVRDFAEAFFKHAQGRRWLFVDEVHNFAPQGKVRSPQAADMLNWMNTLVNEAAGKGITVVSASQRPQKVHKDYVTAHEVMIAGKVLHKLDRKQIEDWMDGHDATIGKQIVQTLAHLDRSEKWVWSPEEDFGPKRIQFPLFSTYDSFKPQAAQGKRLRGWASVNQEKLGPQLEAVAAEKKANDPAELRKQITVLKAERAKLTADVARLSAKPPKPPKPQKPGKDHLAVAEAKGFARGLEKGKAISATAGLYKRCAEVHILSMDRLSKAIDTVTTRMRVVTQVPLGSPTPRQPVTEVSRATTPKRPAAGVTAAARKPSSGVSDDGTDLPKGERAILTAIVQFGSVDRPQLTGLTGYGQSTRDTYIKRLSAKGFVSIGGGKVESAPEGVAALGDYEPIPTGVGLQSWWMTRLPVGECKVLAPLIKAYPNGMDRNAITEASGYGQSTRDTYIKRLSTKKIVEIRDRQVFASPVLFD